MPPSTTDLAIQQVDPSKANNAFKFLSAPTYLIILDDVKKGANYFLAVKFDDSPTHYAKCVGVYTEAKYERVVSGYDELIKATPTESFVEVMFPWSRIKSVQSLVYKFKGMKSTV